jgi:hypothetical protein
MLAELTERAGRDHPEPAPSPPARAEAAAGRGLASLSLYRSALIADADLSKKVYSTGKEDPNDEKYVTSTTWVYRLITRNLQRSQRSLQCS